MNLQGYPPGHYRLWITPGYKSLYSETTPVSPDYARVLAAIDELKDVMVRAMQDKNKLAGRCRQLDRATEEKGWKAFREAVGTDEPLTFGGVSMQDVVDAGVEKLGFAIRNGYNTSRIKR
jgi:hypothetical protein